MLYVATAYEATTVTEQSTDYYYSATSTTPDKHLQDRSTNFYQGRYFSGQIPSAVQLPLKQVAYSDNSGGSALGSVSYSNVAADSTSPSPDPAYTSATLIQRYDDASAGWLTVWIYKNDATGAGMTTVDWRWDAGEVTYHSEGYCKSTAGGYTCRGGDFTRNTTDTSVSGVRVALGANYGASVVVDDGTAYSAKPAMALNQTSTSDAAPAMCNSANLGGPTPGKICFSSSSSSTSKDGTVIQMQP